MYKVNQLQQMMKIWSKSNPPYTQSIHLTFIIFVVCDRKCLPIHCIAQQNIYNIDSFGCHGY